MSIIFNNVRRCIPLRLLHFQTVRYNKSKLFKQYLERMNIIENDPLHIYVEIINKRGDSLNNYNDFDRVSYNDIYVSDNDIYARDNDIYCVNKDKLPNNKDPGTTQDTSESSNNTDNK